MPQGNRLPALIDVAGWDLPGLAERWRAARPFPHLLIDGLLGRERLKELRAEFAKEPHWPVGDQIYEFVTSGWPPARPGLVDFFAALSTPEVLRAVAAISGEAVTRLEGRGYVYLAGSYLLPHADYREGEGRAVAFVYYLAPDEGLQGGELELFDCVVEGGELVSAKPALRIEPRPDRLALFAVSPTTLHQVREVLQGGRASLAGWFYR